MITLLAILATTRASPVDLQSTPFPSLDKPQGLSCDNPMGCRSLWDIIRSCAVTILLCTWFSVHPNIPSPTEKWPSIALRRIGLTLITLLAPEAVIAWALRQRQTAVKLAMEHKEEGWTVTHGFFAIMGGFMEYEGNRPIRVLLPNQLQSYSLTGNGDFPRISEADIDDKSKGDAISKGVVILQTSWFVTQCIARGVQGLPITELELVTVAFAVLNLAIFILWWEKPLNVGRGVRVYKKRTTEELIDDGEVEAPSGLWGPLRDALSGLPTAIVRGPFSSHSNSMPYENRIISWLFLMPYMIIFGSDDLEPDVYEGRVTTFYPKEWDSASGRSSTFTVTAIGLAFGGIHCIGWSFTFPSTTEQIIWRVASLSIIGVPIALSLLICAYAVCNVPFRVDDDSDRLMIRAIGLSSLIYTPGRLTLLILPFLGLRLLPPAAYHVVNWTSFILHL